MFMTGAPGLILPTKHPRKNYETKPNYYLSTLFSINWQAQIEANFQAGWPSNARLEPRITSEVNDEEVGFTQVIDVQGDWPGKRGWIGPGRDLTEAGCMGRPLCWQGV